jgi:nicotinamide-nucleotide amidase
MSACIDGALVERASVVLGRLGACGLTIVTAESCTAGLICAALAQGDGAAELLHGSFVTYTKANKTKALGVSEELLRTRGSVNAEVARQLARGALERSPADIALAVTGVLGPEPDEDGNPVGLVFLCCLRRDGDPLVQRLDDSDGDTDALRRRVVLVAFDFIEACSVG